MWCNHKPSTRLHLHRGILKQLHIINLALWKSRVHSCNWLSFVQLLNDKIALLHICFILLSCLKFGNFADCHPNFTRMACNVLYPECIHHGPTLRPCRSECEEITAACSSSYEAALGTPWPLDCSLYTDLETSTEGFCLAANVGKSKTVIKPWNV